LWATVYFFTVQTSLMRLLILQGDAPKNRDLYVNFYIFHSGNCVYFLTNKTSLFITWNYSPDLALPDFFLLSRLKLNRSKKCIILLQKERNCFVDYTEQINLKSNFFSRFVHFWFVTVFGTFYCGNVSASLIREPRSLH
jgi:hypothetical protein